MPSIHCKNFAHCINRTNPRESWSQTIDVTKFLLIIGVVIMHSNLFAGELSPQTNTSTSGFFLVNFVSRSLARVSVPGFFLISGFLFFKWPERFSFNTYRSKLKRRFYTLLIPYLIWNVFGICLTIIKARYLGFPSYGIIEDNHINLLRAILVDDKN